VIASAQRLLAQLREAHARTTAAQWGRAAITRVRLPRRLVVRATHGSAPAVEHVDRSAVARRRASA
jgi:hypothetical protein